MDGVAIKQGRMTSMEFVSELSPSFQVRPPGYLPQLGPSLGCSVCWWWRVASCLSGAQWISGLEYIPTKLAALG